MSDAAASAPAEPPIGRWTIRKLVHPATLMLLGSNAIPVIGLLFWRWDAYVLLLGFWMETAVIGFWTLVRIAARPEEATGDTRAARPGPVRRVFVLAFIALLIAFFMTIHFVILREAFGGDWRTRITGVGDFLRLVLWQTGLWVAVLAAFVTRGISCLLDLVDPVRVRGWILAAWPDYPGSLPQDRKPDPGAALVGLGARIVLLQVAMILGGFAAVKLGLYAPVVLPLMLLIAIKTYVELSLHISYWPDAKNNGPPASGDGGRPGFRA